MNNHFGTLIKNKIREKRTTVRYVAEDLGMPLVTLYGYIEGKSLPSLYRGLEIMTFLNISVDEILGQNWYATKKLERIYQEANNAL